MAALRAQAPVSAPSEQESVGALVARLGTDITRIIRAEIALLQVRASEAVAAARNAGIAVAVGVTLALAGVGVFMFGFVFLLARLVPLWASAFIVGGGALAVAGILVAVEVKRLTRGVTEAFTETAEELTDTAKGLRHGE